MFLAIALMQVFLVTSISSASSDFQKGISLGKDFFFPSMNDFWFHCFVLTYTHVIRINDFKLYLLALIMM